MNKTESNLILIAVEAAIKARNLGYEKTQSDLSLQITKEETENYIVINIKGYDAAAVALGLKSVFSAVFSVQINSNDNVNILLFKKS